MQAVEKDTFLTWLAGVGIGFDPRYPGSDNLSLHTPTDHARFWVVPADPATWPHFTASLVEGLDEWAWGFVWPKSGRWPDSSASESYNEGVRDVLLRGAGVPNGWPGALRFMQDEKDKLLAVFYASVAFGWHGDDDLFFVPDHGRQLLHTDHHGVIHASCVSEERIVALVKYMTAEGYELPEEPPDWTFKWPTWMAGGPHSP